jgi:osmotically-inducible protein OsmY
MKTRIPALILAACAAFAGTAFAQTQSPANSAYLQRPVFVRAATATQDPLKDEVIKAIARDTRLAGLVGVETFEGNVTLTGIVLDTDQVDWLEQDALGVTGVINVSNLVTPGLGDLP